jgi:hypothetical protein
MAMTGQLRISAEQSAAKKVVRLAQADLAMQYESAAQMAPGIVQQKPQAFGVGACGLFLVGDMTARCVTARRRLWWRRWGRHWNLKLEN